MLFLMTIALLGLYGSGLYYWYTKMTWSLKANFTLVLKQLHFVVAICCLLLLSLHMATNLSLASMLAIRIILGLTLITGIPLYIIGHRNVFKRWESYYFRLFALVPLLALGFLLIPFVGIVFAISFIGWFVGPEVNIYYEDSKIRVASFFAGPLGPPHLGIYEKKGWLEKDHTIPSMYASSIDSVQVRYDPDSTRVLIFYKSYVDGEEENPPQILGIEKIK